MDRAAERDSHTFGAAAPFFALLAPLTGCALPCRIVPLMIHPACHFHLARSVFTAVVEAAEAQADSGVTQVRFAKLNLIDLAGGAGIFDRLGCTEAGTVSVLCQVLLQCLHLAWQLAAAVGQHSAASCAAPWLPPAGSERVGKSGATGEQLTEVGLQTLMCAPCHPAAYPPVWSPQHTLTCMLPRFGAASPL